MAGRARHAMLWKTAVMPESLSIGARIKIARHRRGLSQAVVANLVGRSESWLSQVERGIRSVDRLPVLMDLAEVLHVEPQTLLGRPWRLGPNGATFPDVLAPTRHYLNSYSHLLDDPPPIVGDVPLAEAVRRAFGGYQAARYGEVAQGLPDLLASADLLVRESGPRRVEAMAAYVSTYSVASKLMRKLGALDLAAMAADRASTVAMESGSFADRALTSYQVVESLLWSGQFDDAETLAITMAGRLSARVTRQDPTLLSAVGALWLLSSVIAARRADKYEALGRLNRAQNLADELGDDANYGWTAFGPTNVAIHRVSVAAELGEAGEALRAARQVDVSGMPVGLVSRRAQLHIDLAWACAQTKQDGEATLHLLEAEKVAPESLRYNVLVREHVREMLTRQRSGSTTVLHDLAVRSGIIEAA